MNLTPTVRKRLLNLLVLTILLTLFAWYLTSNLESFGQLRIEEPVYFLPILLSTVASIYCFGKLTSIVLKPLGVDLNRHEIFGLATINSFCNIVLPGYSGAAIRAAYLKKAYKFSYAKFSSTFIVSTLVFLMVAALVATPTYFVFATDTNIQKILIPLLLVLLFFATVTAAAFVFIKKVSNKSLSNKFARALVTVIQGFGKLRSSPIALFQTAVWGLLGIIFSSILLYFLYSMLDYQISFIQALFITALSVWGLIIAITPGNIGVREGIMVFGAQITGIDVTVTVAVVILFRLVVLVVSAICSFYYAPVLLGVPISRIMKVTENNKKGNN